MAEHKFKVGDLVTLVKRPGSAPHWLRYGKYYRVESLVAGGLVRLEGVMGVFCEDRFVCHKYKASNPFKVGDMVVHKAASVNIGQKVAEVDGEFIRVIGSAVFDHCNEYTAYKHPQEVIVITTDGKKSKAILKRDGKVVNQIELRKHPDDKHDLKVLTAFAVQKLLPDDGNELAVRKGGYYGAVAVIGTPPYSKSIVTPGLILEFHEGKLKNNPFPCFLWACKFFRSFAEVKETFSKNGYAVVELHR